ncbi:MAG: hypothetical protein ACKN9T_10040 [Candidatus Methylumidiphilus sp.]
MHGWLLFKGLEMMAVCFGCTDWTALVVADFIPAPVECKVNIAHFWPQILLDMRLAI